MKQFGEFIDQRTGLPVPREIISLIILDLMPLVSRISRAVKYRDRNEPLHLLPSVQLAINDSLGFFQLHRIYDLYNSATEAGNTEQWLAFMKPFEEIIWSKFLFATDEQESQIALMLYINLREGDLGRLKGLVYMHLHYPSNLPVNTNKAYQTLANYFAQIGITDEMINQQFAHRTTEVAAALLPNESEMLVNDPFQQIASFESPKDVQTLLNTFVASQDLETLWYAIQGALDVEYEYTYMEEVDDQVTAPFPVISSLLDLLNNSTEIGPTHKAMIVFSLDRFFSETRSSSERWKRLFSRFEKSTTSEMRTSALMTLLTPYLEIKYASQ